MAGSLLLCLYSFELLFMKEVFTIVFIVILIYFLVRTHEVSFYQFSQVSFDLMVASYYFAIMSKSIHSLIIAYLLSSLLSLLIKLSTFTHVIGLEGSS